MCGFVGFTNCIDDSNKALENMMNRIIHRGPDSGGSYIDGDIALGFRRLSIIDLEQGDQPILNEDSSKILLFNGEIYNFRSIREKLVEAGHIFKTKTDSEVLLHGYEEYGKNLLNMLRGMFAFVIWDKNTKELFGARDFFGIKPLYYSLSGKSFLFGSEIKSFLPHPHFKKELNTAALENYLTFQYSPQTECFFKNVYKLPAAHCFTYKNGELNIERYWEIKFEADEKPDLESWVNKISDTFHDSVEAHKIADVEVGSFLSSGVDSSYVAAVADVDKTFTVGFGKDEKYNEIGWAKEFSKAIGKENTSKVISPEEYWGSLEKIQYHMDEPLADPAAVALYFVCNIASQKLKVVLSGEGADEIFGGYPWFREKKAFETHGFPWCYDLSIRNNILLDSVRKTLDIDNYSRMRYEESIAEVPTFDGDNDEEKRRREISYLNINWFMTNLLDRKDRMSMASGLEVRVPFCDHRIARYAFNIPWEIKAAGGREKGIVRRAMKGILPDDVLWRKKSPYPKTHNPTYLAEVIRRMRAVLADKDCRLTEIVSREKLLRLCDDPTLFEGNWYGQLMTSPQIFAYLLQIEYWLRRYDVRIDRQ